MPLVQDLFDLGDQFLAKLFRFGGIFRLTAFGGEFYDDKMINLNNTVKITRPNGWPERSDFNGQWCHSDMKDVSFFFNFKFYQKVVEKGESLYTVDRKVNGYSL